MATKTLSNIAGLTYDTDSQALEVGTTFAKGGSIDITGGTVVVNDTKQTYSTAITITKIAADAKRANAFAVSADASSALASVTLGKGADTVIGAKAIVVDGSAGGANIIEVAGGSSVVGGAAADKISIAGKGTVNSGAGNDSISVSGTNAIIDGSAGNDTITAGDYASVSGGAGNDVFVVGTNSYVDLGAGNDIITNVGKESTIVGNAGSNTISLSGGNNSVVGGSGVDKIITSSGVGSDIIDGGAGADQITLQGGHNTLILSGINGADVVFGYDYDNGDKIKLAPNSTITGAAITANEAAQTKLTIATLNETTSKVVSSTVVINGIASYDSTNKVYINENTHKIKILDSNDNVIYNQKFGLTSITASDASADQNDVYDLSANTSAVTIDGSAGDGFTAGTEVIANAKNNLILAGKNSITIDSGEGNDTIYSGGEGYTPVTIGATKTSEGTEISASDNQGKHVFVYSKGNDVITYYDEENDSIIVNGKITASSINSKTDDVVFTVTSSDGKNTKLGTLTIKEGHSKNVTIYEEDMNHLSSYSGKQRNTNEYFITDEVVDAITDTTKTVAVTDTTKTFIDATEYDESDKIAIVGHGKASTIRANKSGGTITAGVGNDILVGYEESTDDSADLSDIETGSVTYVYNSGDGADQIQHFHADKDVIKLGANVSISAAALNATTGDVTLTLTSGKTKGSLVLKAIGDEDSTSETKAGKTVFTAPEKITIEDANGNQTKQAFGAAEVSVDSIDAYSDGTFDAGLNSTAVTINAAGEESGKLNIIGNAKNNVIYGGDGSTLYGGTGNDTLVGTGSEDDTVGTVFVFDGVGKDVISGYRPDRDTIYLRDGVSVTKAALQYVAAKGENPAQVNVVLTIGKGTLTIVDALDPSYAEGAIGVNSDESEVNYDTKTKKAASTIKLTFYDEKSDTTYRQQYGGTNVEVSGADGRTIDTSVDAQVASISAATRTTNVVELIGNSGANTLQGSQVGSTLTGGSGKDVFIYNGIGGHVITDYEVGKDVIKLDNAVLTKSEVDDNDIILSVMNNGKSAAQQLKLKNMAGKQITIVDESDVTTAQVYGTPTLTVANSDSASIAPVDTTVKYIDASNRSKAVHITGNGVNNTIVGGKGADVLVGSLESNSLNGNAGNDTLYGSSGENSMTGGAGNDYFYFQQGNDNLVITDYNVNAKNEADIIVLDEYVTLKSGTLVNDSDIKLTVTTAESVNTEGAVTLESDAGDIKVTKGTITGTVEKTILVKGAKGKKITIVNVGSYTTATVSKKTVIQADSTTTSQIYGSSDVTISTTDYEDGEEFDFSDSEDIINVYAGKRAKTTSFIGNSKANSITGGTKSNTISAGLGDDYVIGGAARDIFIYTGGNDTISSFTAGTKATSDVVVLAEGTSVAGYNNNGYNYYVDGKDLVLNTNQGKLTILNGASQTVQFGSIDSESGELSISEFDSEATAGGGTQVYNDYTVLKLPTVANANKLSETLIGGGNTSFNVEGGYNYDSNVTVFDASGYAAAVSKDTPIVIAGNTKNQSIVGSKGTDSIYAATGNNTITTGAGKDTLYFDGTGNVTLTDYTVGQDIIQLAAGMKISTAAQENETDVRFTFVGTDNKVASSTLYIQNAIKVNAKTKHIQKLPP